MKTLKSARHHWWPESLSQFWNDDTGGVHRITPDGAVRRAPAKNFGVIGNGHHIKLGDDPNEITPWDESFENEFAAADNAFPAVIDWLNGLHRDPRPDVKTLTERFVDEAASSAQIAALVECLVSLAVRSPMTRDMAVGLAERFRGPLPQRERNRIIGLNLRHVHRTVTNSLGSSGKVAVLYSPDREFIFGDGFFHNVSPPANPPFLTKILAPLTPTISVLFARPIAYRPAPQITTLVLQRHETEILNSTVQVYSKNELFYRTEAPELTQDFILHRHLVFSHPGNTVESLIHSMPGVEPRDTSLDGLFEQVERSRRQP